jgi:lauroyl/myristoyl acyltransferase
MSQRPLWRAADATIVAKLLLLAAPAAALDHAGLNRLANRIGDLLPGAQRSRIGIAEALGRKREDPVVDQAFRDSRRAELLADLCVLRSRLRPGWRPPLRLEGTEHLAAAQAAGRGAVLWVAMFAGASLLTKMALHDAGWPLVHLSRESHGWSRSRLGIRWLNPLIVRTETQFLAERVIIGRDLTADQAVRRLVAALGANRVVSVSAQGHGADEMRIGWLRLPTGAIRIALAAKAPLLPVLTHRGPDGVHVVRIAEPLAVPPGPRREAVPAMARQMAALVDAAVRERPAQYVWRTVRIPDDQ